jgi:hypothetical protein
LVVFNEEHYAAIFRVPPPYVSMRVAIKFGTHKDQERALAGSLVFDYPRLIIDPCRH